jgi:hypothetical protein
MKLNHDCVRQLLLCLEDNLKLKSNGLPDPVKLRDIDDDKRLFEFTEEDIYYTASKLVEAKYITVAYKDVAPRHLIIKEITWVGHDYLDSIRDTKVWNEIKSKTKDLSGVALDVIKSLAIEVTKNMLGLGT